MMRTLDLADYSDQGVGLLAGRERGEAVRKKARLNEVDADGEAVRVVIPDYIYSIGSSFFLGLFGPSVISLGETEFRNRYTFQGPDADEIRDDGIRAALILGTPFSGARKIA